MTKKIIIGLAGRAGSGKTTAARYLDAELGFTRLSFAAPIKNMVGDLLLHMGYGADFVQSLLTQDKDQVLAPLGATVRQLMQTLGTEWGRQLINQNLWIIVARRMICAEDSDRIVFDDVRFENEAAMIRDMGGIIIHIDRGDWVTDAHSSEAGIMDGDNDFFVDNDTSIDDFCGDVAMIARGRLGA